MQRFWESIAYRLMLPARFRLSQARTGTRETAADIPFRKTGNGRIFSVLFDWTCDEIVIPSTPADFPGTCRIYGEARQSICSRMRRRKQRSSSTWGRRDRPRVPGSRRAGLNPPYQIGGYHSVQLGLKPRRVKILERIEKVAFYDGFWSWRT